MPFENEPVNTPSGPTENDASCPELLPSGCKLITPFFPPYWVVPVRSSDKDCVVAPPSAPLGMVKLRLEAPGEVRRPELSNVIATRSPVGFGPTGVNDKPEVAYTS